MSATTLEKPEARGRGPLTQSDLDRRGRYFSWFCGSVLLVFAAIWVIPVLWAVVTSLRPEDEIGKHPTSWWSSNFTFDAYRQIMDTTTIGSWYVNSFLTSALSAFFTVIICSMAAFALSQLRMRGRGTVMGLLLAGIMIPGEVTILPRFSEFSSMHLLNTYWALILPTIPTPIAVFVFVSFFNGIPGELVESARMDGAGWFRIYSTIFMPLCKPAISAVTIFTFVWTWNSFLWPLLVLTSTKLMTIPVGLASVQSTYGIRYAQVMATSVLGALPLLVVFLLFQRRIVEGIANTGFK